MRSIALAKEDQSNTSPNQQCRRPQHLLVSNPQPVDSMKGLVSIITPTYNSAKYIRETIASVQNQSHANWEMILIDDCSTENTVKIIKEAQRTGPRIQLIRSDVNEGPAVSRNK